MITFDKQHNMLENFVAAEYILILASLNLQLTTRIYEYKHVLENIYLS